MCDCSCMVPSGWPDALASRRVRHVTRNALSYMTPVLQGDGAQTLAKERIFSSHVRKKDRACSLGEKGSLLILWECSGGSLAFRYTVQTLAWNRFMF